MGYAEGRCGCSGKDGTERGRRVRGCFHVALNFFGGWPQCGKKVPKSSGKNVAGRVEKYPARGVVALLLLLLSMQLAVPWVRRATVLRRTDT